MSEKPPPREPAEIVLLNTGDGRGNRQDKSEKTTISQYDIAERFVAENRDELRFDHTRGKFFRWNGSIWKLEILSLPFHRAATLCKLASHGADDKILREARKASFASGVVKLAGAWPGIAVDGSEWDRDPLLLGTPGGTINLETGELFEPRPEDLITRSTAAQPAATADCPLWLSFLGETCAGNRELIRFLQQWCGYSLTGFTREQKLLFLYGDGGNGKGVFTGTVSKLMGTYAVESPMSVFLAQRFSSHPTEIAFLAGARMVTANETEQGHHWDEARVKVLTGGDRISARFMRRDFFSFDPNFSLMIVGNHLPELREVGPAMKRRFLIAPFVHKPAQDNQKLADELKGEWPGILRWMIDGALDWQANGLVVPDCVRAETLNYFEAQDVFSEWLEAFCDCQCGNDWIYSPVTPLFESWSAFCRRNGSDPGSAKSFGDMLVKRHFPRARNNARGRHHIGIQLKPVHDPRAGE